MTPERAAGARFGAGPGAPPPSTSADVHGPGRLRLPRRLEPYLYVAPFFVLFAVFGVWTIGYTAWVSLHDWHIFGEHSWVGLENYRRLASDPFFRKSVVNTFSILVVSTVPQLFAALVLAAILNERWLRGRHVFRVGMLVPNITSVVAVAIVFESIFGRNFGLLNGLLEWVGAGRVNWQGGFASHLAIATMVNWRWTGYNAIIYLAAMQGIPADLYESATVDGASRTQQFFRITIPLLRPVIIFTVVLSTIGGLQIFAEPLLFAQGAGSMGGAGGDFLTVTLYLYNQAFRQFRFGYASAIAWMLFLIIVGTASFNIWLARRIRSVED